MWAYLAAYPGPGRRCTTRGCTTRARARCSRSERFDDYRARVPVRPSRRAPRFRRVRGRRARRPDLLLLVDAARRACAPRGLVAVHNPRVAADLRDEFPGAAIETLRLGVARARRRTPAARTPHARRARRAGRRGACSPPSARSRRRNAIGADPARLRSRSPAIVPTRTCCSLGDAADYPALGATLAASPHASRVHVTGYVADEAIGDYLAAADVCLCLRWPTALETSASWLQCLAAARPTVITDLAHLVDIPTLDPRGWTRSHAAAEPVAVRIDLLDEDGSLELAMRSAGGGSPRCGTRWGRPATTTGRPTTRWRS